MRSILARRLGAPALLLSGAMLGLGVAGLAQSGQPHMRNALGALNTAKSELLLALHDKGGHRANALKYVNAALSEVNAGITYSATH